MRGCYERGRARGNGHETRCPTVDLYALQHIWSHLAAIHTSVNHLKSSIEFCHLGISGWLTSNNTIEIFFDTLLAHPQVNSIQLRGLYPLVKCSLGYFSLHATTKQGKNGRGIIQRLPFCSCSAYFIKTKVTRSKKCTLLLRWSYLCFF